MVLRYKRKEHGSEIRLVEMEVHGPQFWMLFIKYRFGFHAWRRPNFN